MLAPRYPIETDRLTLRAFTESDLDAVYELQSSPDVTRYLLHDVRDLEETRASLAQKVRGSSVDDEGQTLSMAVVVRDGGMIIGDLSVMWLSREHQQGEIGFVFHPDHQGKGYAKEASEVGLRLGFDDLGLHRIIGRCDARNLASARLMERLGMRLEAHLVHNEWFKGGWGDELVYAMLDDEWRQREERELRTGTAPQFRAP